MESKRNFIKKHEKIISLAILYFWEKQRKKISRQQIEKYLDYGYVPKVDNKIIEDEYKKFTDKFIYPLLLLYLGEGEKTVYEKLNKHYMVNNITKNNLAKKQAESRAKYFSQAHRESTQAILRALNPSEDNMANDIFNLSLGLSKRDTEALIKYNEALKNGKCSENIRKKKLVDFSKKKRKERAKNIGATETAQGYSKMVREIVDLAKKENEWEMTKTWKTSGDDRVCPICRKLGGMTIDMDDVFPAYGGIIGPEESHPRCRCDLEYHVKE